LPTEAVELINVVRLRWKAMKLGFEKLTLKNNKLLAYFLNKQQSDYFASPMFQAALQFAQKYPGLCTLKEQNNKLYLTVEDVRAVKRASEVMDQIQELIKLPEIAGNEG
jgi:transcription-repair coupling factor (superfamily II helicase)